MQQQINDLLQQSQLIAKEVRCNNWDTVQVLAEQRQKSLEQFFSQKISSEIAPQVVKMTNEILAMDKLLVNFIENEKTTTFKSFSELKHQNKANKSYQSVALMS